MSELMASARDEKSQAIIAVAQRRDRECFRMLFDHFAPRVKSYLLRLGTPSALAEELAQETLLNVWRKADRFDPARASASTWIFTIARNLRIDLARRRAGQEVLGDVPEEAASEPSPGDEYLATERSQRVGEALKGLPPEQAEIIRLSFFEEKPHPEIAAQLHIPLGTVKSRVRLAMNRLRSVLEALR